MTPVPDFVLAYLAGLEPAARPAELDRLLDLLHRPALGAYEPFRSRRLAAEREAVKRDLRHIDALRRPA